MVEYYVTGISKTAGSSRSYVQYKLLDSQHASPGLRGTPEISREGADGSAGYLGALPRSVTWSWIQSSHCSTSSQEKAFGGDVNAK